MPDTIILASGSEIRATLLRNAGVSFDIVVPRVDEDTIKASLIAEQASPRDIADALADEVVACCGQTSRCAGDWL